MIVSHQHRYIFVQFPRTGCTAIASELVEHYGGQRILRKHSNYEHFLKQATPDERGYFAFSSVRNPLDRTVSLYLKLLRDHKTFYSRLAKRSSIRIADRVLLRQYAFVNERSANFGEYFLKFYKLPYDDWTCLSHHKLDYVVRYEQIADDFRTVLQRLGVEPKRPLPLVNQTTSERKPFSDYYSTPELKRRAMRVFGPYMQKWGYEFPRDWGAQSAPKTATRILAVSLNALRKPVWKYSS